MRPVTSSSTMCPKSLLNRGCASAAARYTVASSMCDESSRNIEIFVPIDRYLHKFYILVPSLYALFWTSYTHPQFIQIFIFHDRRIYGVYFVHYNPIFIPSLYFYGQVVSPNDGLFQFLVPSQIYFLHLLLNN